MFLDNKKAERQLRSNGRTDNFYDSSIKTIKLTRGLINSDLSEARTFYKYYSKADVVFFKIYQPLIVFSGHLYVKRLNADAITPIRHLQFSKQYKSQAYDEDVTIHVVSSNYIQEYLDIIRPYYMACSKYIIDHQNELKETVRNDLIQWEDFNPFPIKF